jgi:nitrogen fixation/metabolism regulation signal transduction histidine kinase
MQQKPRATPATKTTERNSWPPCTLALREEEITEKLSKEILEQSENLDETSTALAALKKKDEIQRKVSSFNDFNLKRSASLEREKGNSVTKDFTRVPEVNSIFSFVHVEYLFI